MHQLNKNSGMTLIELMVSIAIMTVITAGAFKVYSNLQSAHERILKKAQILNEYQRFWNLLEQDLSLAINRSIRPAQDGFGGEQNNLFPTSSAAFAADQLYFQFSRNSGLPNLTSSIPQSELRRVAYGFDDGKIYRYQWGYVDPGEGSTPAEMIMLENIEAMSLKFGYLPQQNATQQSEGAQAGLSTSTQESQWQWLEQWLEMNSTNSVSSIQSSSTNMASTNTSNTSTNTSTSLRPDMPQVVQMTLDTQDYGTITRVFSIGAPNASVYSSLIVNSTQKNTNSNSSSTNSTTESNSNTQENEPGTIESDDL